MKVYAQASFIRFVYPFLFDGSTLSERKQSIERSEWKGNEQERKFRVWRLVRFPKDDLLAHVERYLNPPEGKPPTALLWQMDGNAFQSPSGLGSSASWKMTVGNRRQIDFQLTNVQIALFRIGVGFLTIETNLNSDSVDDWLDFLHYFRFAGGQRSVQLKAQRRTGKDQFEPYFPPPAGGTEKHPEGVGTFMEILSAVMQTAKLTKESERWWREVFIPNQLIPFAVLYVDDQNATEEQIAKLLYRVRNFFPSSREIAPSKEDLNLDNPSLLPYADKMWFVFAQEGSAFVAFNAPPTDFFRRELPAHLRNQYFLLFLLTLHQKFALMNLSQEVSEHWLTGNLKERTQTFERIRNDLLDFTARGYFAQVMQRDHHHRVYRKWQETFQLEQLYREVSDEVREMHEFLLAEQTRRLEQRLNQLGAFIGLPALVLSFLSINLYGITAKDEGLHILTAISIGIISFCLGGFILWLLRLWR